MGNTDKNKTKKCRRKIKIRLADPNIPDSYICEIFDSSLENEEENSISEALLEKKPKNYFELLMPKRSKKNGLVKNNKNKILNCGSDEEVFEKNKLQNQKNKNSLTQSEDVKKEEIKCETDSSEDESLFQIQKKFKVNNFDLIKEDDCITEVVIVEEVNSNRISNKSAFTEIEPPEVDSLQKKTISILNYFSKTQSNQKNNKNYDVEEMTDIQHPRKTCKIITPLKPVLQDCAQKQFQKSEKKVTLNGIKKENVKLAPLFYKKANKVIDSAKQKARLEFLYKSAPSFVKKSENKNSDSVLNFPTISHVQQRNDSVCWSLREIQLPLSKVSPEEHVFVNQKKFSLQIKHLNAVNNTITNYAIEINKEFLCKIKCKYLELNLDCVIDGLKEKKDKFLMRAEEIEKSKIQSNQQDSSDSFEELNILWTEKYKPKSCEILGNENVVRRMKKWLQSWKLFDEELKALVKTSQGFKNKKEGGDDSEDDFLNSDSENYGLKAPGNVCIISGPNGCGKTALVYALANELEFGVLELNASSKRTGKKVLSDLQEATQSHKVHRVNLTHADTLQNEMMKKKSKRKKKNRKLESKKILDQTNDSKISLILIEDADIVFDEHDEGFFSAISSLVQTSKRPLIFLTNEPNCHYLYNFKTEQCLILEMKLPNFYISCAVLDIVSSLEGKSFDKEILEAVVRQNNFDLRKSLLQLQFWIHSSKNPTEYGKKFDLGHLWWGLCKFLYKQDIKHSVKSKSRKRKRKNDLFDSSDDEMEITSKKFKQDPDASNKCLTPCSSDMTANKPNSSIGSYFRVLDLFSVLDEFSLPGSQEPIPGFEYKAKDSLSLDENMEEATWVWKSLREEISSELVTLSARIFIEKENENENRKLSFISPCWEEIRWRNSQKRAAEKLSDLVSLQRGRDNRSLYLDYLPVLRNICRVERNRSEMNPKRKNRFYHYLNNLGFELTDENLEINCNIFDQ